MRTLITVLVVVCLALMPSWVNASETFRFRTFSPKGGFYYDGVVDINQDTDGFIWVMLDNELLRFDGYEYRKYTAQFNTADANSVWSFINLATDTSGCLHVLTSHAIYRYDRYSDSFVKIVDAVLGNMAIDSHDNMWCLKENILHHISRNDSTLTACMYDGKPIRSIRDYSFGKEHTYFSSRYNRVYVADADDTEKISILYLFPPDHAIVQIQEREGVLWVLTARHGIYGIDTATRTIGKHLQFQDKENNAPAKTFLIDRDGRIWAGTQMGLYVIDSDTGEYRCYRHSKADPFSLTNNSVWTLFSDMHGNIWIGHFAGGLCYTDLDDSMQVSTYTSTMSPLNYELVSSFAEYGDHVYIGTDGGGLNCLDTRSGNISQIMLGDKTDTPSDAHVKSMAVDSRGRLWVAMYRGGLDCHNLQSRQFRNLRHNPADSTGLLFNDLRKITLDRDSGLWIAYQNVNTLISYLPFDTERCVHYNLSDTDGYVFDIQPDSHGNLYVLTRQKLFRINPSSGTHKEITGAAFSGGQSLAVDSSGDIWIGTVGDGLTRYNPSSGVFTYYPDILSSFASAVYSMSHDSVTDCLWLGTDNGLVQFDIHNAAIRRFDECDGFQGQVYYPLSAFRSVSGRMFFGGTNGFSVFEPGSIMQNPRKPQARISGFYIDNRPASPSIWKGPNEIVLDHDQGNFGFSLSSDNYQTPEKNSFRYRLKGYDDEWITTNASNRTVMYSKVPPGSYQFEVLAANNDGVWCDTPATIHIVRRPAPWASPLAYLLYTVIAVIIILVVVHYKNEKRKLKLKLFMVDLDKKKKEELHKSQLSFFTNISHDFRTPISLILAAIDNMKQEGMKDNYYRILHNNSRRLLNLVNELMDFRTLDNNKMKLHVQTVDANALVKELAADFEDYARKRNITFTIKCDPMIPESMLIDRQVLEKVVMNLLNNAFKYTADGGEITVETYSTATDFTPRYKNSHIIPSGHTAANAFTLAVRDTGCGISADSIRNVFERYYLVNTMNLNQHLGTGIGLALVKSLVQLHHGGISIYSERNAGTDIVVSLPVDRDVFDASEVASEKKSEAPTAGLLPNYQDGKLLSIPDSGTTASELDMELEETTPDNRRRILLVEDHADLRNLMAGFLKLHYEIDEATDGEEAIEILKRSAVDLIISDIMMPRKDGITLCREVKSNLDTSHIPVMLLTAKAGIDDRIEGADAGADLYFAKPIDFNLLLQSVHNIFRHQKNLREHYARNYYADRSELSANRQDADFLSKITEIIDTHLQGDNLDVNLLATEMCMSRSKLYSKLKALTGKSIVEFITNYRMRKAARLIVEQDIPLYMVMEQVGIRSQSHFVNTFKKEFGETPSSFMAKHRHKSPLTTHKL